MKFKLLVLFLSVMGLFSCNNQNVTEGHKDEIKSSKRALIIVDMQYDFMEGGSLEVKNASSIIEKVNAISDLDWDMVVATKDWHPKNHVSFASNNEGTQVFEEIILVDSTHQVMWPDHCVQGSHGSEIHTDVDTSKVEYFVLKGQNPNVDSYSAFFDNNHTEKTDLDNILKSNKIESIYVVGLARDYCTYFTALDGKELGYDTYFVFDATLPVNEKSDEIIRAELEKCKVNIINTNDLVRN